MNVFGRVHSFESFSTVDGPGIRSVVFLQGCSLKCIYCHNPDTWNFNAGKFVGSDYVVQKILEYRTYIKNGGVTLSGGEPLLQPKFAFEILKNLKSQGIHTAVESSCAVGFNHMIEQILEKTDLLILDLKAANENECKKICNANISKTIKILNFCEKINKKVWVRHVLLPNFTLKTKLLESLAEFLTGFSCIERVELLPFHKMGEFKWEELNLKYILKNVDAPSADELQSAIKIFKKNNLNVVF